MREAISLHDDEWLSELAHWLKGSGGTAGFDLFTQPAKALQQLADERADDTRIELTMKEIELISGCLVISEIHAS